MTTYYARTFCGHLIETNKLDFDYMLDRIRKECPSVEYKIYSGFGIQVSKWILDGKELLILKEYFEAYEEIEENAEE